VTRGLGIPAVQRASPAAAVRRLASNDFLHLLHRHPHPLGVWMPWLGAPLAPRGRARRFALDLRPVRRRRARGVLRILLELRLQRRYLRLQGGNALLVPLHHQPEHRLALRWNPVPQFLGQRRLSSHGTGLHIRATAFTQVWDLNGHLFSMPCRMPSARASYTGEQSYPFRSRHGEI
jgi:hypothetical protein